MTNITHDGAKLRIRVRDRAEGERVIKRLQSAGDCTATYHSGQVSVYRAPQRRVQPSQVWQLGAALVVASCLAIYTGSSHADECADVAPVVLAKRPAMSYAPLRHRHRGPAALRKREVGCTRETLPAAVEPLGVSAAKAPVPVVDAAPPAAVVTPRGAIAAAAVGDHGAAVPLGVLVAGIAVCFVAGPCDGHGNTAGGHSVSTVGTTGTK